MKHDINARKGNDQADNLWDAETIAPDEEMSSDSHHEGAGVHKDDRPSGICIKHSKIDAGELQTKEKSCYKSMKEHNVGVK